MQPVAMFEPDNQARSPQHHRIYLLTQLAYTLVDFFAAALFVVGSLLFFNHSTTYAGTWMFLIGSVLFGLKPTILLGRELIYLRLGNGRGSDQD